MNRFAIRSLDEIINSVSDIHADQSQTISRAICLSALATVAGHNHVKTWLVQRPAQSQREFMRGLLDLGLRSCAPSDNATIHDNLAFDVLAVIGELVRREHSEDSQSKQAAERGKKIQAAFITVVCSVQLPPQAENLDVWGLLNLMKMQFTHDEVVKGMAEDLLDALPTKVVNDTNTKKTESNKDDDVKEEEQDEDAKEAQKYADAASILSTWTKAKKEKSKDLLFIDETRQAEVGKTPLVCRALKLVCAHCNKESSDKTKYFSACGFCRAVAYCSADCQKAHWSSTHKLACLPLKKAVAEIPDNKEGNKRIADGSFLKQKSEVRDAFLSLFFESRAVLYSQRNEAMKGTSFSDFFMNYSQ